MTNIYEKASVAKQPNEGEGSRTAARSYNRQATKFAKSGKVEEKAREAQQAVDGEEGKELAEAEKKGKIPGAGADLPEKKQE